MSRDNDLVAHHVRLDMTDQTVDTHIVHFSCPRPVKVKEVVIIGGLPLDSDTDTVALDVSYSTDGFSASDVEIAALSATEFNDTDVKTTINAAIPYTVPLTSAALDSDGVTVRVPADADIRTTITASGASADGFVDVYVWYIVL